MTQPMPAPQTYASPQGARPTTPWVAIAALAIGISAFVISWVPAVGAFLGLVGLVLGVIALVSRRSALMSAIATGLSVLAILIGSWTTVAGIRWLADLAPTSWDSYSSEEYGYDDDEYGYEDDEDYSYEGDGEYYGDDVYGYYPRTGPGSFDEPLTQPRTVQYDGENEYTVSAQLIDDADATILAWSEYNDPAPEGFRWVLMEATITGRTDEGTKPSYADYNLMIASAPDVFHYSESFTLPDDIPYLDDQRTLDPGESFTGVSAYLVPADATELRLADGEAFITF